MIIGVGTNRKLTSRLIRRATRSWCSHAWIEIDDFHAIHAVSEGVVKERLPFVWQAYPHLRRYELVGFHPVEIRLGVRKAIELIGHPYDFNVIVNGISLWWWYLTGIVHEPRRNPRALHCSEFACLVLRSMPLAMAGQLDPETTHPGKLDAWLLGHPQFVEV